MNAPLAIWMPNPVSLVTDATGSVLRQAATPIVRGFSSTLFGWLGDACRDAGRGVVSALSGSASPTFKGGWWASPQSRELMGTVVSLAGALALGFLFLALLQGLLTGDPVGM